MSGFNDDTFGNDYRTYNPSSRWYTPQEDLETLLNEIEAEVEKGIYDGKCFQLPSPVAVQTEWPELATRAESLRRQCEAGS